MHKRSVLSLLFVSPLLVISACARQVNRPLTNADVMNMVTAELPESTIVLATQLI